MARVVLEGVPHHITQRGNNRQDVFLADDDRRFYLNTLCERCRQHGVRLLIAIPERSLSLALAVGQAHWQYTQRLNQRYGPVGHLWQNRFHSCPLGPSHLIAALAYVDLNPVRAGLVGIAPQYPWSSAAAHIVGRDPLGVVDRAVWRELDIRSDWRELLESEAANGRGGEVREATRSGLPCGEKDFVQELETRLGRRLELRPSGPPPKTKGASA